MDMNKIELQEASVSLILLLHSVRFFMLKVISFIYFLFLSLPLFGANLNWSGQYRFEIFSLQNPTLLEDGDKSYVLHHFVLKPQIIAADGLKIHGRFDLFNNENHPIGLGDFLGNDTAESIGSANSFQVTHLYLQWVNEYGAVLLGRAPFHFGLGMSYSSGEKKFAHSIDTLDMLGYKVVMGHLFIMPLVVRWQGWRIDSGNEQVNNPDNRDRAERSLAKDEALDLMLHVQYDNPDTDLSIGLLYTAKKSGDQRRDFGWTGGSGAVARKMSAHQFNIFVGKQTGQFEVGVETAFLSGHIGDQSVELGGFGIAGEIDWKPGRRLEFFTNLGYATGDDEGTSNKYEGFLFDRNYDVGMLLFNHVLGRGDVLQTGNGPRAVSARADVERVANAIYINPGLRWKFLGEKWIAKTSLLYAFLEKANAGHGRNLGLEWNASMSYRPHEYLMWVSGVGLLFPGSGFAQNQAQNQMALGLETKLAVQF